MIKEGDERKRRLAYNMEFCKEDNDRERKRCTEF